MSKYAVYNGHAYGVDDSIEKAFRLLKSNSFRDWEGEYIVAEAGDGGDVDTWHFAPYRAAEGYRGEGDARVEVELKYERRHYSK